MSGNAKLPTARGWRELRQNEAQKIIGCLPEIAAAEFILTWDLEIVGSGSEERRHWIIRHGEQVIYREQARSEDYHRFEFLAPLLRQKYGSRVRDLVPVDSADVAYSLYGDFLGAVRRVEAARKRIFGDR